MLCKTVMENSLLPPWRIQVMFSTRSFFPPIKTLLDSLRPWPQNRNCSTWMHWTTWWGRRL